MTLLCFLLDLRTISPQSLRDVKQALLQLANLYVLSPEGVKKKQRKGEIPLLRDQIALCYLHWNRNPFPSSTELKIVYRPGERFSVRDFHHAVNSISWDGAFPDVSDMHKQTGSEEIPLTDLLSNNALYRWGSDYLQKKVIIICSPIPTSTESLRRNIMDAADKCITVEFVVLERAVANLNYDDAEKLMQFSNSLCDLENCVIRSYLLDNWVLNGLVKKWFQELEDVVEDPIQALIFFKNSIVNSVNQIYCSLLPSSIHLIDGFRYCQTCKCHGSPIDTAIRKRSNSTCPVTLDELGESDLIDNVARIGEQAVLFLPPSEGCPNPQRISAPITFSVIECTSLASLNEGLIIGTSFYVTPSCHDESALDESDKVDLNVQAFYGLCRTLFLLDQGLVCSSACNTETMQDGTFLCYYLLQPSEGGQMLLRRLASSEEIMPIPDTTQASEVSIPEEVENSIRASLKKIELRDYNPLQHERGVHAKLNLLVKESLQFGSVSAHPIPENQELSMLDDLQQPPLTQASQVDISPKQNKDDTSSRVTKEWEKFLIVDELSSCYSLNSEAKNLNLGAQTKPLDEKTSRILERLEAPKQQSLKAALSSVSKNLLIEQIKRPLMPFNSNSSQPLKPKFHKLKRKQW